MSPEETNATGSVELISFEIGGQEFCIDVRSVREIRGWTSATPLPQTPRYILGVINLRGAVMPILDLRQRLGLGFTEPSNRHVIVVVEQGHRTVGVLVDGVRETFRIDAGLLQEPPTMTSGGEARFVDALIPTEGRMLSRLVVDALMPLDTAEAA